MISRLERIARGLLEPINIYAAGILGALTLTWGIWIVNPFLDTFPSAQIYSRSAELAPEWAWGTWATACGLIILIALFKGAHKRMVFTLGFAVWHWFVVAMMCWLGDWHNTAGITYSYIALWTAYAWLNMKVNGKQSHF